MRAIGLASAARATLILAFILGDLTVEYSGSMRGTLTVADDRLAAIVLAAGGSTRLGRPKQLLRYRGKPLLLNAVERALRVAGSGVIVVVGAEPLRLRTVLRHHCGDLVVVNNPRWREGLATSLRAGIRAVPGSAAGVLVMVVDQARLEAADIARLADRWRRRPSRPAAAWYQGRAGVPAIIPRRWFGSLTSLEGDVGARQLLRRLNDLSLVAMPEAGFDVDTPADVAALRR